MNLKKYILRVLAFGLVCAGFFGTLVQNFDQFDWRKYPLVFALCASGYVLRDWYMGKFD